MAVLGGGNYDVSVMSWLPNDISQTDNACQEGPLWLWYDNRSRACKVWAW